MSEVGAGGKGDGGKPHGKKSGGGFWSGLKQFGSDFADAFARNVSLGVSTGGRPQGKPAPVDYSKQMNDERQSAVKQLHRSMKAQREAPPMEKGRSVYLKVMREPVDADDAKGAEVDEAAAGDASEATAAEAQGGEGAELEGDEGKGATGAEETQPAGEDATKQTEADAESGKAEDAEEKQAGGEGEAPEEPKTRSVAAKLKGVHRKVFRTPSAGGAANGAAAKEETVTETGTMSGAPHTLTVNPVADTISLDGANAIAAGQTAAAALPAEDPRTAEAKPMLDAVNAKLEEIRSRITKPEPIATTDLRALSKATMTALQAFGDKFDVKRLGDPLPAFPAPLVGPHPMTGPKPPDKKSRESHHVPPKELAQSIRLELVAVRDELKKQVEQHPELKLTIERLTASEQAIEKNANGNGLTAILIHQVTHQNAQGTAAHSATMKETILAGIPEICAATKRERILLMSTASQTLPGALAVNPDGENFKPFMEKCKAQASSIIDARKKEAAEKKIQEATAKEEQLDLFKAPEAAQKTCGLAKEQSNVAFQNSFAQAKSAISAALNVSHIDGTPEERAAAIAQIDAQAPEAWKSILEAAN